MKYLIDRMVKPPQVSENICLRCKGARMLCGKPSCPILMRTSIMKTIVPLDFEKVQRDKVLFGASPPAVFVGRYGYPNVSMGPMVPIDEEFLGKMDSSNPVDFKDTSILDLSEVWWGKKMEDIVTYRTALVRSTFPVNIFSGQDQSTPKLIEDVRDKLGLTARRLLDASQDLAMAKNSVDTETKYSKLQMNMQFDINSPPLGPSGSVEKIQVIDNIKVHPKVDYVINDKDLKAEEAIFGYLYQTNLSGNDVKDPRSKEVVTGSEMHRLLSSGLLGIKRQRKLVPTRWSITAVDSIISKHLAQEIKKFPEIDQYYTFQSRYLDNNFLILLIPGPWSYEMMEIWNANTIWTQNVPGVQTNIEAKVPQIMQDHEMEHGRTKYADNITGAYYAARKEVTEFLYRIRRQARCVIFREVSNGYIVPLGVWVIRETIRDALRNGFVGPNVQVTDNLSAAVSRINGLFTIPLKYWMQTSQLLKIIKKQPTLDQWARKIL